MSLSNVNFNPNARLPGSGPSGGSGGKPPIKKGFVVRREGDIETRLFFRLEGTIDPNDAVVVFVHGIGSDSRIWRAQQKTLSPNYATLAVDLRGFGLSSKPNDSTYNYDMFVDDIKVVLDTLSVANVIYVGVGLGASIGIRFANKYSGYIVQIALSGLEPLYTADRADWPFSVFTPSELQGIWEAIDLNYTAFAQQFASTLVFPEECKGIQSLRDYSVKTLLNVPQAVFLQIFGFNNPSSFIFEDIRSQIGFLNNLKIPIMLLSGTQAGAAYRGANSVAFTQLITSDVFIYEFLAKGLHANATDVNRFDTVLVNFLRIYEEEIPGNNDETCDLAKDLRAE